MLQAADLVIRLNAADDVVVDRKSTRLNSSHLGISYAVFCLKKKKKKNKHIIHKKKKKVNKTKNYIDKEMDKRNRNTHVILTTQQREQHIAIVLIVISTVPMT